MEVFSMSQKERERLHILKKVKEGSLTQLKAAQILNITDRHVRNLLKALEQGDKGIISKKRGQASNRSTKPPHKVRTLHLINSCYSDFGPTLAAEKLRECHNITFSKETIRKWMIDIHLWIPHQRKRKTHLLRKRKEYFGEMLQGDGSHHDWFESGSKVVLLYFIDDATSIITAARFEKTESLDGYFNLLEQQIKSYGSPVSLYTDRFSVFEVGTKKENLTQFQIALKELGIKWIGANSPQAKGRIERFNQTFQDRLVKELRLRGIKTIEEANEFLKEYIPIFNNKFSRKAMKPDNLHRPLEREYDIPRTLSRYEERTLTKDLLFQYQGTHYQVIEPEKDKISGKKVEIRCKAGVLRAFVPTGKELTFKKLTDVYKQESKIVELKWHTKQTFHPGMNHPWKAYSYAQHLKEKELKLRKEL